MSLLRQGRWFAAVGGVQWLVDWGVMFFLSHAGVPVAVANVAGRVSGAAFGFWLNGRVTFARDERAPRWRQLLRYVALWCATTTLSTLALSAIDAAFGLRGAWLGKPLVDGVLAIASFLASRHWVYR
jgi:putative flippase GtrA